MIQIHHTDCFTYLAEVQDNSYDLCFTSPPYNRKRNDVYDFHEDIYSDYFGFLVKITDELLRVTKNQIFFNIQKTYYNKHDVFRYIGHYSEVISEIFIWSKANPKPANGKNITNSYEYIICLGEMPKSNFTYTKNHLHTVINTLTTSSHKAVMNLEVAEFFIKNFTQEKDIIFDPFSGLGTTGVASLRNNRRYVGTEIVKEYVDMSLSRMKKEKNNFQLKLF